MYSPAFSALFELILSHNARIAPSNKLKNSSKMQVQNCGTYSFNITKLSEHPFYYTMKILRETLLLPYERQIYKNSGNKNYLTPLFISYIS